MPPAQIYPLHSPLPRLLCDWLLYCSPCHTLGVGPPPNVKHDNLGGMRGLRHARARTRVTSSSGRFTCAMNAEVSIVEPENDAK